MLLLLGWPRGLPRLTLGGSRSLGWPIDMSFSLMQQSDGLLELYKVDFFLSFGLYDSSTKKFHIAFHLCI
jgi:hypothetical protein